MAMKALWIALLSTAAFGQALTEPPALIRLSRVDARLAPDDQLIRAYSNAGANVMVLGLNAVSGPAETWSIELHGSFASIESVDKVLASIPARDHSVHEQDDVIPPSRSWIALYRDGLS